MCVVGEGCCWGTSDGRAWSWERGVSYSSTSHCGLLAWQHRHHTEVKISSLISGLLESSAAFESDQAGSSHAHGSLRSTASEQNPGFCARLAISLRIKSSDAGSLAWESCALQLPFSQLTVGGSRARGEPISMLLPGMCYPICSVLLDLDTSSRRLPGCSAYRHSHSQETLRTHDTSCVLHARCGPIYL